MTNRSRPIGTSKHSEHAKKTHAGNNKPTIIQIFKEDSLKRAEQQFLSFFFFSFGLF